MTILSWQTDVAGQVNVNPRRIKIISTDNLATVTAAGYLNGIKNEGFSIYPTDFVDIVYSYSAASNSGTNAVMIPTISQGIITLSLAANSNAIVAQNNAGQVITADQTSATPGTVRSLTAVMSQTATTMTSGNIAALRGEVDYVGSSTSAYIYGVQGKLIPTGTLASGQFQAAVFGQLNISAATINGGQLAPIWGDYGTSSGTLTNQTGLYGIAMTNTTAAVLAGQLYLYGGATNLMLLNTNAGLSGTTYFQAAGTGASSCGHVSYVPAAEALQISVNGTSYWIPLFSSNS